ncbi:MAG: BON domain-containing protein [Planctomycetota bacterium]
MRLLQLCLLTALATACTSDRHRDDTHAAHAADPYDTRGDGVGVDKQQWDANDETAQDQSNESGDLALLQNVRQALVNDDALSFNAKNVKVIVRNGDVTLRGVVKDAAEHERVVSLTRACAGVRSVIDQIETESP